MARTLSIILLLILKCGFWDCNYTQLLVFVIFLYLLKLLHSLLYGMRFHGVEKTTDLIGNRWWYAAVDLDVPNNHIKNLH